MTWQYDIEWHNGGNRKDRHRTISDLSTSTSSQRMVAGMNKKEHSDITNSSPNYEGNTRMNVVVVTSKPRSQTAGNLITTHTWTSLMEKEDTKEATPFPNILRNKNITDTHQNIKNKFTTFYEREEEDRKPVAIYTQILRGASPILRAKVIVSITVEQTNGSMIRLPSMELKDDGYGGKL
jgi:Trp operon repressor